jgi:hypothetical protein
LNIKTSNVLKKPIKPTPIILLVSLVVHIGLIALVSLVVINKPAINDINNEKPSPPALQSYLLIPKPSPQLNAHTENKQAPVIVKPAIEIKQEEAIIEKPKERKVLENTKHTVDRVSDLPLIPPPIKQTGQQSTKLNNQTLIFKSNTDQKYGALISKHLINYNAAYSQQQAQEYRALSTSPLIDSANAVNTQTIVLQRPVLEINCNNTGSQVLAAISGLMNGTVSCANNDTFQFYIDQRLNAHTKKVSETEKEN